MSQDSELVAMFESVLRLCNVQTNETLVVLTEGGDRAAYASAYLAAAEELGAHAFQVNVPMLPIQNGADARSGLTGNTPAIETLKSADIIIDLMGLLWSQEQLEILAAGTRMLMSREPPEIVARMFPTVDLRRRVEAGEVMLSAAQRMRITSRAGTDVTYRLGKYPVVTQYGYTDQPGRWDNLPSGFLFTGGDDDGVDGVVVIDRGDILFPFMRYVTDPIKLVIEKGNVTAIEGAHLDAELMRSYMRRWNDSKAYAISHIGWGMDEKAHWDFLGTDAGVSMTTGTDGRSFYGNVLFSTGPNSELGGTNDTGCHLDIPLRGCSLYLDNEEILKEGEVVPPALRAEGR